MTALAASGLPAGTPASVSPEPASPVEPTNQEPKPLTIADVERIAEEKATRIAQSMVDKAENRISKKAQDQIKALELTAQTLGLSAEQMAQAKSQIVYNDLTTPAEPASPAPSSQQNQRPELDPVIQETLDVFQAEGISIDVSDPEYKPLDNILRDPNGNIHLYRKELYKQIEAKRQRTASLTDKAAARVVSGGIPEQGAPATGSTTHELWSNAYKNE
jgi:hypothetical protein